ncbi:hypothetical protein B0O80DRAFT_229251 [Mortierella sp. GBAus27b]|nr:hypothetical protein B0O80DRAFT_229251 [Mortierella sp. GBAus27b]
MRLMILAILTAFSGDPLRQCPSVEYVRQLFHVHVLSLLGWEVSLEAIESILFNPLVTKLDSLRNWGVTHHVGPLDEKAFRSLDVRPTTDLGVAHHLVDSIL